MTSCIELVILAGGRSSRMGEDKLRLRQGARLLIETWLDRIAWPTMPLLVLPPDAVAPLEIKNVRVARDAIADNGPLQGVLTAIDHRQSDWQLIVPIDMPNLRRPHLDWLCAQVADDSAASLWMSRRAIGKTIGKDCAIEPFPLLIHADLRPAIETRLNQGRRSLHRLAEEPSARVVDIPADWTEEMWLNLNNPADLERFLADCSRKNLLT